jgi:Zn-dependent peptidase ImmA (M78 family)
MRKVNRIPITNLSVFDWAQKRLGFKDADLIKKHGKYEEWKKGIISPTENQLKEISKLLNVPVYSFFVNQLPEEIALPLDLRSQFGIDVKELSPETKKIILDVKHLQDTLYDILSSIDGWTKYKAQSITGDPVSDAGMLRPVSFSERIGNSDFYQMRDYLRDHYFDMGIITLQISMPKDELSGFCLYNQDLPVIVFNSFSDSITRRIFTMVHEYYHILSKTSCLSIVDDGRQIDYIDKNEKNADIFAANFLVPNEELLKQANNYTSLDKENMTDKLRSDFCVSHFTILNRMLDTGIINRAEYKDHYKTYVSREKDIKKDSRGDYYRNIKNKYGKGLVQAIIYAESTGKITTITAMRALNMTYKSYVKISGSDAL